MTAHFSLRHFPLYVREGFFWGLPSIYTYLTDQCIRYPAAVHRYAGNNEVSVAREPNSSDASVFTKIRRSALRAGTGFCSFSAFLREQRFCERKSFPDTFGHPRIHTPYLQRQMRQPRRDRGSQPARQSSRARYAVGLRCVCPDGQRQPALNADYSGSNGSGRSAATVSAYHQVWASLATIGSKGRFSVTATQRNADVRWIFLNIQCVLDTEFRIFIRIAFIRYLITLYFISHCYK